jgi:urate oxidase
MPHLGPHRYGKSGIRLVTVTREGRRHELTDLTVDVWVESATTDAYTRGDNSAVLPTDTMRGTVYAFARDAPPHPVEAFALRLAEHFATGVEPVSSAEVHVVQSPWQRIPSDDDGGHDHAFTRGAPVQRVVRVHTDGRTTTVEGGVEGLVMLKSAGSSFSGFLVDPYTTLTDTDDRILASSVSGRWQITDFAADWDDLAATVQRTLLSTFADHDSASVQHTLYAMGTAVLEAVPALAWIRLSMPNLHHVLVDLSPCGRDNPNAVFVATDRPFGAIEAVVRRDEAPR